MPMPIDRMVLEEEVGIARVEWSGSLIVSPYIRDCKFEDCDLSGTKFFKGNIVNCSFENCNLSNVRFDTCYFVGTVFGVGIYSGATFCDCYMRGATLNFRIPNVTFVRCKGIAQVYIPGMSSRDDVLTAILGMDETVTLRTGCFKGDLEAFSATLWARAGLDALTEFDELYLKAATLLEGGLRLAADSDSE